MQLTLIGTVSTIAACRRELPAGYSIRQMKERDEANLAKLYFAAYPQEIIANLNEAVEEMKQTFAGEYGQLALDMSCIIEKPGVLVGTIMTVERAPWSDTPDGPFVIEAIIHPEHRRLGLAQAGLVWVATQASKQGAVTLALRVESENLAAMALYQRLGFEQWQS